jgi:predicted DNA-binding transcriptional regulator YafY
MLVLQSKAHSVQPICTAALLLKNFAMPTNKQALFRYAVIDECLQRTAQHWTIEKLRQAVSAAHNERTGSDQGISLRTLRNDLADMKPGGATRYEAPICHDRERGYYYSDPEYSIHNTPLTGQDLALLKQSLQPLRTLHGLGLATELDELVRRLEQRIPAISHQAAPILHFEDTPACAGIQHLQGLYEAVRARRTVELTYRPYYAQSARTHLVHPYLLKLFNHRWFLIGHLHAAPIQGTPLSTYALDRIEAVAPSREAYRPHDIDFNAHFQDVIGVSRPADATAELVRLRLSPTRAPYVLTKPFHASQQLTAEDKNGIEVCIRVVVNPELITALLGFGPDLEVIEPATLRSALASKFAEAHQKYAGTPATSLPA